MFDYTTRWTRVILFAETDIRNPVNENHGGIFMEKYGYDLINDAFLNKGTAFSVEERKSIIWKDCYRRVLTILKRSPTEFTARWNERIPE
nr:hypothetical protein [Treponema socranskii]